MKKKLHELLTKETLTEKELDELEEDKEVTELNRLWASGLHAGFTWFDVVTRNNNRYDVYCKLQKRRNTMKNLTEFFIVLISPEVSEN